MGVEDTIQTLPALRATLLSTLSTEFECLAASGAHFLGSLNWWHPRLRRLNNGQASRKILYSVTLQGISHVAPCRATL